MGTTMSTSAISQYVSHEFNRVRTNTNRDFLVVSEVIQVIPPHSTKIVMNHLGTLFALDPQLDGEFRLDHVTEFLEICKNREQVYKPHELESHLQAFFTIQLWANIPPNEPQMFADWIICMIRAENREIVLEGVPTAEPECVHRSHVVTTLQLMIRNSAALELAWAHLRAQTKQTNPAIPVDFSAYSHIHQFALDYIKGVFDTMTEIGFAPEIITDEELSELREAN